MNIIRPSAFAALLACALLATGCDKKTAGPETPISRETKSPGELRLFCWSEYVPQTVIDKFTEETGINVYVENYASNEEMLAKLQAGGALYDLVQPSEYATEMLIKEGMLLPLNKANIPNFKNLAPEFVGMGYDPQNTHSVPFMGGSVGIVYNKERIKTPVNGFGDVFVPEHAGRIVVPDDAREIVTMALDHLGLPINEINADSLAAARTVLTDWLKLVKVYDSDSPKTALLNGDVDLGIVWSGEGALILNESDKFAWVLPREGAHLFVDNLAIPKTARNKAGAEAFINFILRPEVSILISEEFPYTNPNTEARKLLSPEQLANPASFPTKEEWARLEIFHDIGGAASDIDGVVTDLRAQ